MTYIFNSLDRIRAEIEKSPLLLFLDYDGTLAPIAPTPQKAVLPPVTRKILKQLEESRRCQISIVSGRALSDVKKMVNIPGLVYIGNHGLEIDAPGLAFSEFNLSRTQEILEFLKWEISKELAFFKGAFVEDKSLSLSIHYRQVMPSQLQVLKIILRQIIRPFLIKKEIRVGIGKKVLEVKPPIDWDKGKAVLWVLLKYFKGTKGPVMYIGDDVTDEDAFKALKSKGLTVRVGAKTDSAAQYYFKNQEEVLSFLKLILI